MLGKLKRRLLRAVATLRDLFRGRSRKSPATQPIQVYLNYADWDGLILFNAALDKNANASATGQLISAVAKLSRCIEMFENQVGAREEYNKLATDMNELFKVLSEYFGGTAPSGIPQDRIVRLAMDIDKETEPLLPKSEENVVGPDIDEVLGRYRRVRASLGRFALNENPKIWKAVGEEAPDAHLGLLSHSPIAQYLSSEPNLDNRTGCTPNTRVAVLQELRVWSHYSNSPKICWLNGMAGAGKTTIAYSFCEQLENTGKLAASFFCSRRRPETRDVSRILPSVACQLAQLSRPFRSAISGVLEQNPEVHKLSIPRQLRLLLTTPLRKIKHTFPGDMVIVIDAIDECEDNDKVDQILETLRLHASDLPAKFFITSRPTTEILDNMRSERDERVQSELCLDELYRPIVQKDVRTYLAAELGHIRPADLELFAELPGAHFTRAAALVNWMSQANFVEDTDGLRQILDTTTSGEIDRFYSTTLRLVLGNNALESARDDMILLLHTVICTHEPLPADAIAGLLGVDSADSVHAMLHPLHSVLQISKATGLVATVHDSFSEYMLNQERSGEFHCDARQHNARLAQSCFDLIKGSLPQFNICNLESSYQRDQDIPDMDQRVNEAISPGLLYACMHLGSHLELAEYSEKILDAVYDFLSMRLLLWMEILNLGRCMRKGSRQLSGLQTWLEGVECSPAVRDLAEDAHRFVTEFSWSPVSVCTPHIYVSMLPLWPDERPVAAHYMPRMLGFVNATGSGSKPEHAVDVDILPCDNGVSCAAFSPDGAYIAYGSGDNTIRTWNAHTRGLVGPVFKGHLSSVTSIAYSPDGQYIASSTSGGTIHIWDTRTGEQVGQPLEGHRNSVNSVVYSPDGAYIASGSDDYTIRIWDAHNQQPIGQPLEGHAGAVTSVAYSPDGAFVASASRDKTIRIWDAQTRQLVGQPLEGHTDWVQSLVYSPNGAHIVSGSRDGTIRIWDARTGEPVGRPLERVYLVDSVAYSPDGAYIASASRDNNISVWDPHTRQFIVQPLEGHTASVRSITYSPNGAYIMSSSGDGTIRIWDTRTGQFVGQPLEGHKNWVRSVAYSPDGLYFVSGSVDRTIRIWHASTGEPASEPLASHTDAVFSVVYSPDGAYIVSCSSDKTIRIWDAHTHQLVGQPLEGHTGSVLSVAYSPDGAYIASGSHDRTIRIWDARAGELVGQPLEGHTDSVISVAYSPDGAYIASCSLDQTVCIWDALAGQPVGQPLKGHTNEVWSVAYSPDGAYIASGSCDRTIRIWNAHAQEPVGHPLEGHADSVRSVAYSPNGAYIVSGSYDKTIRIWDARTGELIGRPLQGHDPVCSVAYSPDGECILSGSYDHVIRTYAAYPTRVALSQNAISAEPGPSASHPPDPAISPSRAELTNPTTSTDDATDCVSRIKATEILDDWTMDEDGWVLSPNQNRLLWVPHQLRRGLLRPRNKIVISRGGTLRLDFKDAKLGEDWGSCFS